MTLNTESQAPASRDEYVFTRNFLDTNRCALSILTATHRYSINLMHHLWTKMFGYLLDSDRQARPAGSGWTGTGIWLFDVGETVTKAARLEGFDVSFDATPPPETLPPNASFRHWNVKEDVPEDLVGVFDVVHVRSFSFVLLVDDVPRVVERLFKMLSSFAFLVQYMVRLIHETEPSGYFQWADPDYKSLRIDTTKPETKTPNLSELYALMAVQDPRLNPTWLTDLPDIFASAGFTDVEADKKDGPPHLASIFHEAGLMIHELVYRKTKNAKMQEELRRLLPKAVEETREGAYGTAVRWTVVGRKPEA